MEDLFKISTFNPTVTAFVRRGMRRLLVNLVLLTSAFTCAYLCWTLVLSGQQQLWTRTLVLSTDSATQEHLENKEEVCQRPAMVLNNTLIASYLKNIPKPSCSSEKDWLFLSDGQVWAEKEAVSLHGHFSCNLEMYLRVDDFKSRVEKTVKFSSKTEKAPLTADFFQANCDAKDGKKWSSIMAGIHRTTPANPTPESQDPQWNVLMFGFDSMSRLHFMRKMPKTYKYLTSKLDAVVLEGYNIVGDGTPQALIPILTGYTELELPDTRKRNANTAYVNVYPWVWNNYSSRGYVTAYGEDMPSVGTFTYRLNGFKEQPTDHYMRAFYVEAEKQFPKHNKLCLGSLPRHKVMTSWLRQFYEVYRDRPKFAFCFHGELSHDDFNLLGVADDDVMEFVSGLKNDGLLKNTFLIIMSDHGHRFSTMRALAQGKQEERMPFFSIYVPDSFRKKYPKLTANLETNAQRLATPFDLHPTFLSLLDLSNVPPVGDVTRRDISLFSEIPTKRTCAQAGIEPHWCTCLAWVNMSPDDPMSKESSQAVVDYINEYISEQKSKCVRLTLSKVTRAERYQPAQALLSYKGVLDKDGFVPDLTDKVQAQIIVYAVQFEVHPSGGIYEASVEYDTKSRTFHVDQKGISRVNMYGNQPHCVQEQLPHLMKYCFCKVQLST